MSGSAKKSRIFRLANSQNVHDINLNNLSYDSKSGSNIQETMIDGKTMPINPVESRGNNYAREDSKSKSIRLYDAVRAESTGHFFLEGKNGSDEFDNASMLEKYLKMDFNDDTVESDNPVKPADYVYDIYTLSDEIVSQDSSRNMWSIFIENDELQHWFGNSDTEEEDTDFTGEDEDSNAEDHWTHDYPEPGDPFLTDSEPSISTDESQDDHEEYRNRNFDFYVQNDESDSEYGQF